MVILKAGVTLERESTLTGLCFSAFSQGLQQRQGCGAWGPATTSGTSASPAARTWPSEPPAREPHPWRHISAAWSRDFKPISRLMSFFHPTCTWPSVEKGSNTRGESILCCVGPIPWAMNHDSRQTSSVLVGVGQF